MPNTLSYLTCDKLRRQPAWKLLASDNSALVISVLSSALMDEGGAIPSSLFHDRVARVLEELRLDGVEVTRSAQDYIASWLHDGWLVRSLPSDVVVDEYVYDLSTAAVDVIRFVRSLERPHVAASRSRLEFMFDRLAELAVNSDPDVEQRVRHHKERQQYHAEQIERLLSGAPPEMNDVDLREIAREIVALGRSVGDYFYHYRDQFNALYRDFREHIINSDASKGDVVGGFLTDYKAINDTNEGQAFASFWNYLGDVERFKRVEQCIEDVLAREFVDELDVDDRAFLRSLPDMLLERARTTYDTYSGVAHSLSTFVQKREYAQYKQTLDLLKDAKSAALAIRDSGRVRHDFRFVMELPGAEVRSVSSLLLRERAAAAKGVAIEEAQQLPVDAAAFNEMIAQMEIDYQVLMENILAALQSKAPVSVADVLELFPANRGLNSVIGLLQLGLRHGVPQGVRETVHWCDGDERYVGDIEKILFEEACFDGL